MFDQRAERDQVVTAWLVAGDLATTPRPHRSEVAVRDGSGSSAPPMPSSPCTNCAVSSGRTSGRSRPACSGMLGAAGEVERDDRIAHGQIERHVARDHGHRTHVHRGLPYREDQCDGIVGCGVGVDHDAASRHPRSLAPRVQNSVVLAGDLRWRRDRQRCRERGQAVDHRASSAWIIRASAGDSRFSGWWTNRYGSCPSATHSASCRDPRSQPVGGASRSSEPITRTIGRAPIKSVTTGSRGLVRRSSTAASDVGGEAYNGRVSRTTRPTPARANSSSTARWAAPPSKNAGWRSSTAH